MSSAPPVDLRLIFTYDQFGTFAPARASYGWLAGSRSLERDVLRLRSDATTSLWIDGGDFSAGGVLAPATDGRLSWAAIGALHIDVAVPGNHEFDFGDQFFDSMAARIPFPLIAMDVPGLPGSMVSSVQGSPTTAIIGLSLYERRGSRIYLNEPPDMAQVASHVQSELERLGQVDRVVLVVHEGVPRPPDEPPGLMRDLCREVSGFVDVVLGAHTLQHHHGRYREVEYVQPWPMGAELAVVDFHGSEIRPWFTFVDPPVMPWDGPGAPLISELQDRTIGHLARPLYSPAVDGRDGLADALCEGMLTVSSADISLATTGETDCMQPALDGTMGYLPAGRVTEADLYRALPWAEKGVGDALFVGDLRPQQVQRLEEELSRRFPKDVVIRSHDNRRGGLTVIPSVRLPAAEAALGGEVDWEMLSVGMRDALRAWIETRST